MLLVFLTIVLMVVGSAATIIRMLHTPAPPAEGRDVKKFLERLSKSPRVDEETRLTALEVRSDLTDMEAEMKRDQFKVLD